MAWNKSRAERAEFYRKIHRDYLSLVTAHPGNTVEGLKRIIKANPELPVSGNGLQKKLYLLDMLGAVHPIQVRGNDTWYPGSE